MCDAKPGTRCASDTAGNAKATQAEYERVNPGGPAVNCLECATAAVGVHPGFGNPERARQDATAAVRAGAMRDADVVPYYADLDDMSNVGGAFVLAREGEYALIASYDIEPDWVHESSLGFEGATCEVTDGPYGCEEEAVGGACVDHGGPPMPEPWDPEAPPSVTRTASARPRVMTEDPWASAVPQDLPLTKLDPDWPPPTREEAQDVARKVVADQGEQRRLLPEAAPA